eukprot:gb/GEZN01013352.1/.p1 GENE.gb/GEZN01013352.1/~~gb/GEZN01013352.1/.p1  ORF type:complete len:292 (+),score=42.65 gb/GEZN01013352.1/:109-984(+)
MMYNRVSGVVPSSAFRFGMGGADIGMGDYVGTKLTGSFLALGNRIEGDLPFEFGDDNGIAFAGTWLKKIDILGNYILASEAIEIEGFSNPACRIRVSANEIIQTPTASSVAGFYFSPDLPNYRGGHPAAIKLMDVMAGGATVRNNRIDTTQAPASAVAILATNTNPQSMAVIEGNTVTMNGQYAAVMGGLAGLQGFYNAAYMRNTVIVDNSFSGQAILGMCWLDWNFLPNPEYDLINQAHNNLVVNNTWNLQTTIAAAYFGSSTYNNRITVPFASVVVNKGTDNTVIRLPN